MPRGKNVQLQTFIPKYYLFIIFTSYNIRCRRRCIEVLSRGPCFCHLYACRMSKDVTHRLVSSSATPYLPPPGVRPTRLPIPTPLTPQTRPLPHPSRVPLMVESLKSSQQPFCRGRGDQPHSGCKPDGMRVFPVRTAGLFCSLRDDCFPSAPPCTPRRLAETACHVKSQGW